MECCGARYSPGLYKEKIKTENEAKKELKSLGIGLKEADIKELEDEEY